MKLTIEKNIMHVSLSPILFLPDAKSTHLSVRIQSSKSGKRFDDSCTTRLHVPHYLGRSKTIKIELKLLHEKGTAVVLQE